MEEMEVGGGGSDGGGGGSKRAAAPSFCSPSNVEALLRYWRECMEATRGSKAVHEASSGRQVAAGK